MLACSRYHTEDAEKIGGRFLVGVEVKVVISSFRRCHSVDVLYKAENFLQGADVAEDEADMIRLLRIWHCFDERSPWTLTRICPHRREL